MQPGGEDKPSSPKEELNRAAALLELGRESEQPVWAVFDNDEQFWFACTAAVTASLWTDEAFRDEPDPILRHRMMREVTRSAKGAAHSQSSWQFEAVLWAHVMAQAVLDAPADERGMVMLAAIALLGEEDEYSWTFRRDQEKVALDLLRFQTPGYEAMAPAQRAEFYRELAVDDLLSDRLWAESATALVIELLKADDAFAQATPEQQRGQLKAMKKDGHINSWMTREIERAFELR